MSVTDTGANVTGYVDATYFVGDGANLTGIVLDNITNGNSDVSVALDGDISLTANSNITMTVTETGANVTGFVSATGNITGAKVEATLAMLVSSYANNTARDSAIGSSSAGMIIINIDYDGLANVSFQGYDGSAWGNIALT